MIVAYVLDDYIQLFCKEVNRAPLFSKLDSDLMPQKYRP